MVRVNVGGRGQEGGLAVISPQLAPPKRGAKLLTPEQLQLYCTKLTNPNEQSRLLEEFDGLCSELCWQDGKSAVIALLQHAADLHQRREAQAFMLFNMQAIQTAEPSHGPAAIFPKPRTKRGDYSLASTEFAAFMLGDGFKKVMSCPCCMPRGDHDG